jgi:hypothetical protein
MLLFCDGIDSGAAVWWTPKRRQSRADKDKRWLYRSCNGNGDGRGKLSGSDSDRDML